MMVLKSRMVKHSESMFQSKLPPSKQQCFKVLYSMFEHDQRTVNQQYEIWETLNSAALAYSTADSRKVAVDLETLDKFQDFESDETCEIPEGTGDAIVIRI
jgi:hypothetical protein